MLSYTFSLTKDQLLDCNKKYRAKTVKKSITFFVLAAFFAFCVFFGLSFLEGFENLRVLSYVILAAAVLLILTLVFSKNGANAQVDLYFRSNQVNGIIDYEFQTNETEFVVMQPSKGNVNHYLYESLVKVYELDGYAAVLIAGNQYLPILANEQTRPLISLLQSYAQQNANKKK